MTRKIERLVESSYSDLSPSPRVEEELLANLQEQARPRRSMLLPIAALLLIGVAVAIGHSREAPDGGSVPDTPVTGPVDPTMTLPTVARPKTGVVPASSEEVHVRLLYGSGIRVVKNNKWVEVNLNELGEHLARAGKDKWVVLGIDRRAPWVHVKWIMIVCAEQKMPKVAFAVKQRKGREFRLDATLPMDADVGLEEEDEIGDPRGPRPGGANHILMTVVAVPRAEKEGRWGIQAVRMPTKVVYKFGDREADELATVARWMRAAKKAAPNNTVVGQIKPMAKTPFENIAKLTAEYRHAGYERVDFFGAHLPTAAERAARVLPYPGGQHWQDQKVLTFRVVEGDRKDLPSAQALVTQRLERTGIQDFAINRTEGGIWIRLPGNADSQLVTQLVERQGATLVFHITVEAGDTAFAEQWERRKRGGEAGPGMRWYKLSERGKKAYPKNRLPEGKHPYVLCRLDAFDITGASLSKLEPRRVGKEWMISFRVREEHEQNIAKLTKTTGTYLAMILDGEVLSTPRIQSPVSAAGGHISGGFSEREAKTLAVLLGSEALPVRFAARRR